MRCLRGGREGDHQPTTVQASELKSEIKTRGGFCCPQGGVIRRVKGVLDDRDGVAVWRGAIDLGVRRERAPILSPGARYAIG